MDFSVKRWQLCFRDTEDTALGIQRIQRDTASGVQRIQRDTASGIQRIQRNTASGILLQVCRGYIRSASLNADRLLAAEAAAVKVLPYRI